MPKLDEGSDDTSNRGSSHAPSKKKRGVLRTLFRVAATVAIWFALAVASKAVLVVVPNVDPCLQQGLGGCYGQLTSSGEVGAWRTAGRGDWFIAIVALLVSVWIMYGRTDEPAEAAAGAPNVHALSPSGRPLLPEARRDAAVERAGHLTSRSS